MNNNVNNKLMQFCIFSIILITGYLFRFYNINFDDLWIDEIATFWISDPKLSLEESHTNHKSLEQIPFLFNFIVKIFYKTFGYKIEISRYLPFLFSFFSILTVSYISKLISKNYGFIFTSFLISYNIFLIGYSQELRVYSALFFFNSISIIFFLKCFSKYKIFNLIFFNIFTSISILLHPFSIILLMSYLTVLIFFKNVTYRAMKLSLVVLIIFSIVFYYHFINASPSVAPSWILQPDLKFFTNFYFSKFFGSRLIGMIHLLILFYLIVKYFKQIIFDKKLLLFLILLIYSYLFPLLYGYLFEPILIPRYIIFVLIPIIVLMTHFIYELKKIKKNILIFLVFLITIGNLLTEQTVKQLYQERAIYKPEFNKALLIIEDSKYKNFSIKVDKGVKEFSATTWESAVKHYLVFLISKNNLDIIYRNMNEVADEHTWIFCIHDLNQNKCKTPVNFKSEKVVKLNRLDLILAKSK